MRLEKIYIQLFFLLSTIFIGGCRLLTDNKTEPESVVEPVYSNSIILTSPESNSSWKPGEMMEIKWTTYGNVEKVDIQLYRKSSLQRTLKSNLENNGSYKWNIPVEINHSVHYSKYHR